MPSFGIKLKIEGLRLLSQERCFSCFIKRSVMIDHGRSLSTRSITFDPTRPSSTMVDHARSGSSSFQCLMPDRSAVLAQPWSIDRPSIDRRSFSGSQSMDWHSAARMAYSLTDTTDNFKPCFTDRPGSPLNAIASPYYQGLQLDWRAALFTGGLPVSYSVKFSLRSDIFKDCFNFDVECLELPDETEPKERFVHERGKRYSCVVLLNAEIGEWGHHRCIFNSYTYQVWITAENEVGSANSSIEWKVAPKYYKYSNSKSPKLKHTFTVTCLILYLLRYQVHCTLLTYST